MGVACAPSAGVVSKGDRAVATSEAPSAGPVQEAVLGDYAQTEPFIFDQAVLHTIDLELPTESADALAVDPYEKVLASVVIDGIAVDDVGVRLRGKIGSFRPLTGKPKLEIDFNKFVDGRRFDGLESLSLNNSVVDCSYLKEPLAYAVLDAVGAPAARTSYTKVTVNGEDYGLYVIVETQDDRFIKANWPDGDGNLYDGKYVWYGDRDYLLLDFGEGNDEQYQLEEGESVDHADIRGVSEALATAWEQPDFYAVMGEVIDWDNMHSVWAGEQWVGQNDGYCINKNNYRVYFDPADGKADLVPWDMDYSFLRDQDWGRDWAVPYGNLARGCFADPTCAEAHRAVVADMLDTVDAMGLEERMDDYLALVGSEILADPKRECPRGDISGWHDYIAWWLDRRSDMVANHWDL